MKKYKEIWNGIREQIKAMNNGKSGKYGKDYMKINLIQIMISLRINN